MEMAEKIEPRLPAFVAGLSEAGQGVKRAADWWNMQSGLAAAGDTTPIQSQGRNSLTWPL